MAVTSRRLIAFSLLALVGVFAGAAASHSEPQPVKVDLIMVDYRFQPDHPVFTHDVPYRLHLENHGKQTHELTAPLFFASATIDNPEILNRERSEIVMQPGETKDLLFTAHRPGTYDLRCSDHDWDGMIGGITVN
jgi:plastocyanin